MFDFVYKIVRPEFFDTFGLVVFMFITILSAWSLYIYKPIPRWALILLLLIGLSGLVVDGVIVYITYIR